ncbi:CysZ protein [Methylohalomonas lacus]|uniref:Sulfate transporter CysZ n=1 Tax=Methylohalomonas lacus TaxID=398773 RepID=A0AAE3HK71_9GAMM|nr:sulfate transporter CysZ [Methylohalomonas lacus]MCS3902703.1 CysZ protein [Methylohalomonas lacus]
MRQPGFSDGVRAFSAGFGLLRQPGIRLFVIIPLLINMLLFAAVIAYGASQLSGFMTWLQTEITTGWWQWLDWILWLLWPLFIAFSLLLVFFTFSILANLIAAPFNGFLAAAVERHLTGQAPDDGGSLKQLPREIVRAIGGEARKLGYFAIRALPLLLLFLIPVINISAPLIWFLFGSWMLALEYLDFPMGNHGHTFPNIRRRLAGHKRAGFGFGMATLLVSMIPVVNFIVMPVAVAGATRLWVSHLQADSMAISS